MAQTFAQLIDLGTAVASSTPVNGPYVPASNTVAISTNSTERLRVDSSGRLLVGTSTSVGSGSGQYAKLQVGPSTFGSTSGGKISIQRGEAASAISSGSEIGQLVFSDNAGGDYAFITVRSDAAGGSSDYPGRIEFSTTADGASSPTERMRISQNGTVLIGKTSADESTPGFHFASTNYFAATRNSNPPLYINRLINDGTLVELVQDNTIEGTISVSGSTVSYNGAHLSRWSQLPSGAERTEILRGSVLSNIDEMCEWGDEENEQLNRMKVSDVEGDKNVSGVFQAWDDDDDTYTNDFYCAMTGDFIIRIAEGVTVERGDLLMSAGDGTAKPQDDDIIRSKTIAKVTSTTVSCTYDDGSYCVPCVLMAC